MVTWHHFEIELLEFRQLTFAIVIPRYYSCLVLLCMINKWTVKQNKKKFYNKLKFILLSNITRI